MFITKRKHDEIVAEMDRQAEIVGKIVDRLIEARDKFKLRAEKAEAELADFRAKRAKANANLIPGAKKREGV